MEWLPPSARQHSSLRLTIAAFALRRRQTDEVLNSRKLTCLHLPHWKPSVSVSRSPAPRDLNKFSAFIFDQLHTPPPTSFPGCADQYLANGDLPDPHTSLVILLNFSGVSSLLTMPS